MGKEEALKADMFQSIINYIREHHAEEIDKAYEYFWDERKPTEILQGTALTIGFMNFEDWLIFDYKSGEAKESFIDIYIKNKEIKGDEKSLLNKIKGAGISLYEVVSVSKNKKITLKDILLGGEYILRDKNLTRGLKEGDIFATRLLNLDEGYVMSRCVYPFRTTDKKMVIDYIGRMFSRYKRNENSEGTMRDFLKDYGDTINIAWMSIILNKN